MKKVKRDYLLGWKNKGIDNYTLSDDIRNNIWLGYGEWVMFKGTEHNRKLFLRALGETIEEATNKVFSKDFVKMFNLKIKKLI